MPGSLEWDPASAEEPGEKDPPPPPEIQLFQQMRYYKSGIWGSSFQSMAQQMGELKPMYAWEMKWKKNQFSNV